MAQRLPERGVLLHGPGVHAPGGGAAGRHPLRRSPRPAPAPGGDGGGHREHAAHPVSDPLHPAGVRVAPPPYPQAGGRHRPPGAEGGVEKGPGPALQVLGAAGTGGHPPAGDRGLDRGAGGVHHGLAAEERPARHFLRRTHRRGHRVGHHDGDRFAVGSPPAVKPPPPRIDWRI